MILNFFSLFFLLQYQVETINTQTDDPLINLHFLFTVSNHYIRNYSRSDLSNF